MARIFWSTWEPGLEGDNLTSGGGGAWTKFLFKKFEEAGHSVEWTPHNAPIDYKFKEKPNIAIFCWRWRLPDLPQYEERNRAMVRQWNLIEECIKEKIPFMVHDQDLKLKINEERYIVYNHGLIFEPSFFPAGVRHSLHFPNPYPLYNPINTSPLYQLVYIGNNYERLDQTKHYLGEFSKDKNTVLYGNWVEPGPGRDPDEIRRIFPNVAFGGRISQNNVGQTLFFSRATIMLHKPEYGPRGFTTIRWAEAASAGCLPFIPAEFVLPSGWKMHLDRLLVHDSFELSKKFEEIKNSERQELIDRVRSLVYRHMKPEPWIQLVERMAK